MSAKFHWYPKTIMQNNSSIRGEHIISSPWQRMYGRFCDAFQNPVAPTSNSSLLTTSRMSQLLNSLRCSKIPDQYGGRHIAAAVYCRECRDTGGETLRRQHHFRDYVVQVYSRGLSSSRLLTQCPTPYCKSNHYYHDIALKVRNRL